MRRLVAALAAVGFAALIVDEVLELAGNVRDLRKQVKGLAQEVRANG